MKSVPEILLESSLSSIWFSRLSWHKRCKQKPIFTPSLGQVAKWAPSFLPFAAWLRKDEFTYKHVFSPTTWSLGFSFRDRIGSLSEKPAKRQMLLLSLYVWNFCTAAGFQEPLWGRTAVSQIPGSPETSGTWIGIQLLRQNWGTTTRTIKAGQRMNGSLWPGLLWWRRCYPDGIKQLRSTSREHWITCAPCVLKIYRWG